MLMLLIYMLEPDTLYTQALHEHASIRSAVRCGVGDEQTLHLSEGSSRVTSVCAAGHLIPVFVLCEVNVLVRLSKPTVFRMHDESQQRIKQHNGLHLRNAVLSAAWHKRA